MGKYYLGIDLIEFVVRSVDNELLEVLFFIFIVYFKFFLWRFLFINYNIFVEVIFLEIFFFLYLRYLDLREFIRL